MHKPDLHFLWWVALLHNGVSNKCIVCSSRFLWSVYWTELAADTAVCDSVSSSSGALTQAEIQHVITLICLKCKKLLQWRLSLRKHLLFVQWVCCTVGDLRCPLSSQVCVQTEMTLPSYGFLVTAVGFLTCRSNTKQTETLGHPVRGTYSQSGCFKFIILN